MNKNISPMISIIMPVYNSELYVGQAIRSVMKQTFENFELLIVDDGSNDQSGAICDRLARVDQRIRVIHKKNGGVCSARNLGIDESRGDYITFIDNDDLYEENFLEVLVNGIKQTNADVIKAGRRNIRITLKSEVLEEVVCTYKSRVTLTREQFSKTYYEIKSSGILSSIWNGLYKRALLKEAGIRFNESVKHGNEDLIFNCMVTLQCSIIAIVPDILYIHYYRIGHSTSMKFFPDQIRTRLDAIELELQVVDGSKSQKELVTLDGIRACFRMLLPIKKYSDAIPYIQETKSRLNFSVLDNYPIIQSMDLSKQAKIDLIILKHRLYRLYFILRKIWQKIE